MIPLSTGLNSTELGREAGKPKLLAQRTDLTMMEINARASNSSSRLSMMLMGGSPWRMAAMVCRHLPECFAMVDGR